MLPPSTVSFPLRAASTMRFDMVDAVGIEPTVFLMSLIYSQLPSPLGTHIQNWYY